MSDRPSRQERKDALLLAAMEHVPFDGWSRQALLAGAGDLDIAPATARRLFARGGDSLLVWLDDWADRAMLERAAERDVSSMRMGERIACLLRCRLEVLTPHREALRRALAARALPQNAIEASRGFWRTVDHIWTAAGDSGTRDFSYYSRRGLLSAVYASTVLYWLDDASEDCSASWAFLDRRIDNVIGITRIRGQIESFVSGLAPSGARR